MKPVSFEIVLIRKSCFSFFLREEIGHESTGQTWPFSCVCQCRAFAHGIDNATCAVRLSVTLALSSKVVTAVLAFAIVDDKIDFEIVFGKQWEEWCAQNGGMSIFFRVGFF